jgi:uncharacterized membrane protein YfcA
LLTIAVFVVAFLYSCVGHAGASGYIAAMTLFGLAPAVIKPTALALNILVATIASWQFRRAGHFSWRLFWPLALASVPCAFLGGYVNLPTRAFKILVGIVLLASAARFLLDPPAEPKAAHPSLPASLGIGAGLGLLSGLTGTGGGIFLTPLGIFLRWDATKTIAAVSAVFILVNSASGLIGNVLKTRSFPGVVPGLALAAGAGGIAGSWLGSSRLPHQAIKRLLAVVLAIAGFKLIFA